MDAAFDRALPEDLLHALLSITNSSSLKGALEILIQSSRTAVGHFDLASKNILPKVLQLTPSIPYSSYCQYLLPSLKLLRNLSSGEITNQNSFIEHNGVGIVLILLRSVELDSDPDCRIIRTALQVLANVALAGEKHQRAIWCQFFPDDFVTLAGIQSRETCDPLCMVIYTCCDGSPGLFEVFCGDKDCLLW